MCVCGTDLFSIPVFGRVPKPCAGAVMFLELTWDPKVDLKLYVTPGVPLPSVEVMSPSKY